MTSADAVRADAAVADDVWQPSYPVPKDEEARLAALRRPSRFSIRPRTNGSSAFRAWRRVCSICPVARITFVDEDRVWFKSCVGMQASQAPRGIAICSYAIMESRAVRGHRSGRAPHFRRQPAGVLRPEIPVLCRCADHAAGRVPGSARCAFSTPSRIRNFRARTALALADIAEIVVHELDLHRRLAEGEAALARSKSALDLARNTKRRFLAAVNHELRTPLNAISGFSQLMADEVHGPLGEARYKGYVNLIRDAGERLKTLIDHVIAYSSAGADEEALLEFDVATEEFLEACCLDLKGECAEREIKMTCRVSPEAPRFIRLDQMRAGEVVRQLANNGHHREPVGRGNRA